MSTFGRAPQKECYTTRKDSRVVRDRVGRGSAKRHQAHGRESL